MTPQDPAERRLTPDEVTELQREVAETAAQEQVGPLPPLESDDPEWVAARWREFAEGKGPRSGRRARWNASALKAWRADDALLDVLCKGRLVARVYDDAGTMVVVTEVKVMTSEKGQQVGASSTFFSLVISSEAIGGSCLSVSRIGHQKATTQPPCEGDGVDSPCRASAVATSGDTRGSLRDSTR